MWRVAIAAPLVFAAAGCSAPRAVVDAPAPPLSQVAAGLAAELVDAAGARASLSSMRVVVGDLSPGEGLWDDEDWAAGSEERLESLGSVLRHELQLALAARMNVLAGTAESLDPTAPFAPTHQVSGSIAPVGDDLELVLRLIALDSDVIVAPARGRLPFALGDLRADELPVELWDAAPALEVPVPSEALAATPPADDASGVESGSVAVEGDGEVAFEGPAAARVNALSRLGHGDPAGP